MRPAMLALLVACGGTTSHATRAVPAFRCNECKPSDGPLISTHAALDMWTTWQGTCGEEVRSRGLTVTSDSGQPPMAEHLPCDFVDYTAKLACNGATCTITPTSTHRFVVVPTSPGRLQVLATLKGDGDTKLLEQRFTVAIPNRMVATCDAETVKVTLTHRGDGYTRGPAQPSLRAGDQACTPTGTTLPATYAFACPAPATTVTLIGADFKLTSDCP
jgi:hypothetical protein